MTGAVPGGEPGIVDYAGHRCLRLAGDGVTVWVTVSVGPRIIGLEGSGANVLAVLPHDAGLSCPGAGNFHFYGGHRLWAAPEDPERTYLPDDDPCRVEPVPGGVRVVAGAAPGGLSRSLEVTLAGSTVVVDHRIHNHGDTAAELAPWAITQLRPGGLAFLPVGGPPADPAGRRASRSLVLWPYTDLSDPRLELRGGMVTVAARPTGRELKLGAAPGSGRLAYLIDGELFVKRAAVDPAAEYVDRGAAAQVFCNDLFCELETLGPLRTVPPGGHADHREIWTVRSVTAHPREEEWAEEWAA